MLKLDEFDQKILVLLAENSREPVTSIAKKVKLRRENVNYKLGRLIKEGIIKSFDIGLNEVFLKLSHYVVYLELLGLDEETGEKFYSFLNNHKNISWVGTTAGKWGIVFDIYTDDKIDVETILDDIYTNYGKNIGENILLKLKNSRNFNKKILGINITDSIEKNSRNISFGDLLDEKDKKILAMLNEDSRISLVEMSKKINLTANGINNRIKAMEKMGVIGGYSITLDWKKFSYEWYGFSLKQLKYNREFENSFIDYLKNNPSIIFYYKYIGGKWDYDLGVIVKNSNELKKIINEIRKKFYEFVKIFDVFLVLDETMNNRLPGGVF